MDYPFHCWKGGKTMSDRWFSFLRIAFCAYLLCAGLLIIVKLVYFSTAFTDQDLFTRMIIHPAAGMLMGFSDQRRKH
jgi:hypothetical protein